MGSLQVCQKTDIAYGLLINKPNNKKLNNTSATNANLHDVDPDLPSLRDLTLSWLRFGYQGKVIESESLQSILDQAIKEGYAFCLVQSAGNIISEDWMLPHWHVADFHQCVESHFRDNDFLVCANFSSGIDVPDQDSFDKEALNKGALDKNIKIDRSCFLVNLSRFQELGRPDLSAALDFSMLHNVNIQPLPKMIDDKQLQLHAHPKEYIDSGSASSTESHITTEINREADLKNLSKTKQQKFLNGIETQLTRGRQGVFLWNIESYADLPNDNNGSETDECLPIENLYCVAAGFKPNKLLQCHGFSSETQVTFFDYSQQALDIRKTLINDWDGKDYPSFCKEIMQRFPESETFYQLWNGIQPKDINWLDVEQLWQKELLNWGGEEAFQEAWLAQKSLSYRFIQGDFIHNNQPLLHEIIDSSSSLIWWSNAFFTISSNWLMSIEDRRLAFSQWIEQLATKAPLCRLYGADYNNTPINEIAAANYANELTQRLEQQFDELSPVLSAKPIRF